MLPDRSAVLRTAPSARDEQLLDLLDSVAYSTARAGSIANLDGKIDDPGAAVMDAAWPGIADAAMRPVSGRCVDRLEALMPPTTRRRAGSSYSAAGTATSTRICGRCSASDVAGRSRRTTAEPACSRPAVRRCGPRSKPPAPSWPATQGPDPAAWRADARPSESVRRPAEHDALDEPADLPAGDELRLGTALATLRSAR